MSFEVLLHVVGASELFVAAGKGALDSLLGSMDLGVSGGMARRRECLLAPVAITVAARIALASALRSRGGVAGVVVIRVGATALDVGRALQGRSLVPHEFVVQRPRSVVV